MKNSKKFLLGIILLGVGIIIGLNSFGVTDIDLLFPGWWTLFIIIPCLVGLFTDRDKWGNITGLLIGSVLLVWQIFDLDFSLVWKIILPSAIILVAIKLIIGGLRDKKDDVIINVKVDGDIPSGTAIFGGRDMNFDGQVFDGAELTAVFGGIECDLKGAIIERDCRIRATSIFGGIDISLPKGVNLKVNSTNVFGGTDDEYYKNTDSPITVYIETVSIFGGVDIK